ncbi:hypothetical protein C6P40_000534 [Pichia californica]|uniref:GDT1 family protein n=1 Tax=Pichia californica TaxID=460514 RepID=A0A9P7BGW6_9ASCO|nr:hypothetical protein C6P42_004684 [[Candida] californica]KAG0688773.1 hypothetical protein C6P40_000534 [[Candida] californica]
MKISNILLVSFLTTCAIASVISQVDTINDNNNIDLLKIHKDINEPNIITTKELENLQQKKDYKLIEFIKSATQKVEKNNENEPDETFSSFYSFYLAVSMIIVSEIGDKTFLIAAIMAMRYPKMLVFSAAASALMLMTILSGAIGHILPQLLSPKLTKAAASILFLVFSFNLLREGLKANKNQGVEEEFAEVEEEIAAANLNEILDDVEKGRKKKVSKVKVTCTTKFKNLLSYISSPIWFQTFSMTFLGEWGDRSQITTIAMTAGADWIMIMLGGCIGHCFCTFLAVVAGQFISSRISIKTILLGGSFTFFIFSGLYGYSSYNSF